MDINTFNKNIINIRLTDDEVSSIFGGYDKIDYKNPDSKSKLDSFLNSIILSKNIILDSKSLNVEIKPEISGCTITLTKVYEKNKGNRKRLRLKGRVALFDNSNEMLEGVLLLYKSGFPVKKSDLYLLDKKYRLIIYTTITDGLLSEYCINFSKQKSVIGYTEEYGIPLCLGNAVKTLGKTFSGN